jgi:hypothetical protein
MGTAMNREGRCPISRTHDWQVDRYQPARDAAREAFLLGVAVAAKLPRHHRELKEQICRALQAQLSQVTRMCETAGAERASASALAWAEAGEAAKVIHSALALCVVDADRAQAVLERLWRLCVTLRALSKLPR